MTTAQKLVTAEQLLLMSHNGQGKRYELVRGVLIERVATGDPHAVTVSRIDYALTHYAEVNDYGETRTGEPGYRLEFDPDTVRAPDVAWIAPGSYPGRNPRLSQPGSRPRHRSAVAAAGPCGESGNVAQFRQP